MHPTCTLTFHALQVALLSLVAVPAADAKGRHSAPACLVPAAAEIDFGPSPIGQRASKQIVLENVCRGPVWVSSLAASPAAFETTAEAPFRIPARQSYTLPVHFTPSDTGPNAGEVRLKASHRQSLPIALRGQGAPGSIVSERFEVAPASFNETLPTGHMVGRTLSVKNTSQDSLGIYFQSVVEAPGTGGDSAGPRLSVLYLVGATPGFISEFEWILRSPPTVDSVSLVPPEEEMTPSLDKLLAYDMVVVVGTPPLPAFSPISPTISREPTIGSRSPLPTRNTSRWGPAGPSRSSSPSAITGACPPASITAISASSMGGSEARSASRPRWK